MAGRFLVLLALIGLVSLAVVACGGGDDDEPEPTPQRTSPPTVPPAPTTPPASSEQASTTGGSVEGATKVSVINHDIGGPTGEYKLEPVDFTFKVGETVEFAVTAETEFHTFTVDELGIDADMNAGETETFTFTFDKAGTFRLICIPHEALGMEGTITVQ